MAFTPWVATAGNVTLPLPVVDGGTGAATAAAGLAALGGAAVAGDIGGTSAAPQVTATHLAAALPVAQGGTGAATAAAALAGLGGAAVAGDIGGTSAAPQVTATHLAAALPVAQGGTGLAALSAAASFQPANPTATASTSLVMMGVGATVTYTPTGSGKLLVTVTGLGDTATTAVAFTVGCRFGTGTAPVNGAAVTGTRFGGAADALLRPGVVGSGNTPYAFTDVISGLALGTPVWFDLAVSTSNTLDAANVNNISVTITELLK